MKKLLIAGAAFLLMAGTGTTALASGANLFQGRAISPLVAWNHHTGHSWHRGVWDGVNGGGFCGTGGLIGGTDNKAALEAQGQGSNGYNTGNSSWGYGCGSTNHHGSGHHRSGHHR